MPIFTAFRGRSASRCGRCWLDDSPDAVLAHVAEGHGRLNGRFHADDSLLAQALSNLTSNAAVRAALRTQARASFFHRWTDVS
jgi:hypothetical protein